MASRDDVELVVFDLGGVLMRLSGVEEMGRMAGIDSEDEVWARWLGCEWVRRFERGRCSVDEFADGVVTDWKLDVSAAAFVDRFRAWPAGLYPGAEQLVSDVRDVVAVSCLSNSNELHWSDHAAWGLADWFDHTFLSHQMDLIKPDPEVFDHVAGTVDLAPHQILFLDDNRLNVDAATTAGWRTHHVKGAEQARAVLVGAGLVG